MRQTTCQKRFSTATLALVLGSLLGGPWSSARTATAKEPPSLEKMTQLVEKLGDDSFRNREQAHRELLAIGLPAREALARGLRSPDLEIRLRSRRLLAQVAEEEFEGRLAAFIADVNGTRDHDLPAWKRYRESIGNTRIARTLFVSMIREEMPLLQAFESGRKLEELFSERVKSLQPYSSINSN